MTIAVLNATGAQSRAIADHLSITHEIRRLSRSDGDGLIQVDTTSEDDLTRVFRGARAVVFTAPLDYRPGVRDAYASRVTRAAERASVGHLVLNTAAAVPDDNPYPVAEDLRRIRTIVQSGATPWTVVQPTIYLDNLLAPWSLPAILEQGVLASPASASAPVSYLSHASLATFIGAVMDRSEALGQVYDIGGPEALTGPGLAAVVAAAVGRPIQYHALDLKDFAAGLNAGYGAPTGDDIADGYRHLSDHPTALQRDGAVWREFGLVPETATAWATRQRWSL